MLIKLAVSICLMIILLHESDFVDAQTHPTRAVRVIVPSTAGGGADVLARLIADQISRSHAQAVVVENRPGASNTIGTEAVARDYAAFTRIQYEEYGRVIRGREN
jgi:tripartite-type tricarboxylate transporter receptor subunit TctC